MCLFYSLNQKREAKKRSQKIKALRMQNSSYFHLFLDLNSIFCRDRDILEKKITVLSLIFYTF